MDHRQPGLADQARIDAEFAAYPLVSLADAALQRARDLGASYADFRAERIRDQQLSLDDGRLETLRDIDLAGLAVRVVVDGSWGFASATELTTRAALAAADEAVTVARLAAGLTSQRVELAAEPGHGEVTWVSAYDVDPFTVSVADKIALLTDWSAPLLADPRVDHLDAWLSQIRECKFYSDGATTALQQRVRLHPELTVVGVAPDGRFETMRTLAPPAGRGWEYLTGTGWDFPAELAQLPELLAEKLAAPSVEPGRYDLVIDSSNLWLTIHESIGHTTELDRVLGQEAAYAGTSFVTPGQLGSLQFGSPLLHVTGDRTTPHGLATIAVDDDGVAAQSFDLITGGVLSGYQLDRRSAGQAGLARSNGCAYADSPGRVPIQRMPNVSLSPAPDGPDITGLIAGVENGIYVVGDKSWSIDMQRYNFQFTGQRFYQIRGGRLAGQLRDVAYQATTTEFWNSMAAVGGPRTYLLNGLFTCGKGQPGQMAPASHGCPAAVLTGVRILNTAQEAAS